MATKIKHKRSSVAGKKPIVSQLESGELAINTADGKVFLLKDDNTVQDLTQRIFENNTEVRVDDPGDSQGSITATVDGSNKFIVTDSNINIYEDVDMENATGITFRELTASGEDGITIKSPDTLPASYTLKLPLTQGTNGQILAIDPTGQLYFNDPDIFGGNVIYVSAEQGDDENDGQSAPVKTVKRACQLASAFVYNPDGTTTGTRINIKVAVGDYTEQNPIIVPDNVVIKGDGLRGCIIRPANANRDMLRVRNACYFGEFTFRDGVDVNFVPLITFDYAVAFDDPDDTFTSRVGYTNLPNTRPTITTSPYIQNASVISFLGGSGAKIDGSKVNSPNVPVIQIEAENPVVGAIPEQGKSMVANAFTHISFGGTGWRLTNDAYAQIVSCFQIFLLNGVYCQSGGYCSITNSATNFGLYALRSSGFSPKSFIFDRAFVSNTGLSEGAQTITIVGVNREAPVEEYIIKFRNPEYRYAHDILLENQVAIAESTVNWINDQISTATPGSIWEGFVYNEAKCYRDTLLIVEAVAKDTWDTGNRYTRSAGLAYYNKNLQDSSAILISGQEEQTIAAIEQASIYAASYISNLDSTVRAFVDEKFDIIKDIINDPDATPDATEVSSEGDVTNAFKPAPTATEFDSAADVNASTNIFTIIGHGYSNNQKLIYDPKGNPAIRGLDPEQTYYVNIINDDEFRLTFDESGDFFVDIIEASTGTHQFLSNVQEFFVSEILSTHSVYQTLILESGAESYEFVPGRAITGTTGASNNSALVYSWTPTERRLVVSIEEVAVGASTIRNQFNETSIITSDHADSPNTSIGVNEVAARTGLATATFTIQGTVDGATLSNLANLPETQIWFHRPSIVNSSSHTWEYSGAGTDYNALPQNGGNTRAEFEQFSELPGRVYSSGTNELGDFKVGDFITAFNRTGNITFRNKVQVDELDALRLSLSDVAIEEISTSVNLGDDELGGPANERLSTQLAVRSFLSNRLGGFIDKTVSTAAVPGAIVQLNTNGQLNADLIPATRQFTNTNTPGYLSRLGQVDEIPAVDLKAGDIATEEYEQIELTFASPINANDGDLIEQAVTGARGYAKGTYSSSLNLLVASIEGEFKEGDDSTGTDFDTSNVVSIAGVSTGQAPSALGSSSAVVDNYFLRSSNTSQYLLLEADETYVFTSATITTVSRTSNVATITTSSAHNLNAGNNVQVLCNDDTTFNVNGTVLATPTTTTFTITNTGSDVGSTSVTGTARTIVTSADGNAQGAVTEVRYGVVTNVDNANITGGSGYTPVSGSLTYVNVPLSNITGVGTGAVADVTVTAGQVTDVDLRRGGTGYAVGDIVHVDSNFLGEDSAGSGFEIEVTAIENRAYVNILGGELFVASASSIDFIEDNEAVLEKITVTLTDTISHNFLAGSDGAGGAVDYASYRIAITSHGLTNGDPVTYNTLGNVAIGGLMNGSVYYAKRITDDIIELYEDYSLLNQVEFLSTPANNNHNITRYNVNVTNNSLIVPAHGLTTGDAFRIVGADLFEVASNTIPSGSRFFIGSVTTNSFTIHDLRSDALSSINGLVTNPKDLTAAGTGTADYIPNNAQVSAVVNTSSRLKANWNSLAVTNIDASNIISGTVSPSRLASGGIANTDTFLRGDSSYEVVVQKLKKANTVDNPITLTGSNVAGEFYGDPVNIGIANVDNDPGNPFSTLGVARFLQSQFDVDDGATGQVFIKDGVVDAGTLDSLDSSYFLNPANLSSPVPVTRGGTNLTTYAVGDIIYAASTGTLNTLNIGRRNAFLKSTGTAPEWGTALDLSEGLDVGSAKLTSSSTGIGQIYNSNVTTLELGSDAENVKIGRSTNARALTSFVASYEATISQNVVVNLDSFSFNTNGAVGSGDTEVPMADTTGILSGMLVTGSGSIPANTTVSGVTEEYIYLSAETTGTIPSGTSLTFIYTPLTLGVRAGDIINISSSGITNLDGSWPVIGATENASSFTIQTDANVTANPLSAVSGTITRDNTIVFRNRRAIFGSAEGSASPIDATLRGEDGIGTNIGGGDFIIQPGLSTGNAVGGDFVVKTGTTSTSSDIRQSASTRLTIDTAGNAAFTTNVSIAGNVSLPDNSKINLGTGNDLQIYHDGSNSYIDDAGTGVLAIRSNSVRLQKFTGEEMIQADADGAVTLYYDNAAKLATSTTGISVTGDVAATTVTTSGNVVVGGNLTVNGTTTTINTTELTVDDKNIELGSVASPTDTTADGGGITLKGSTDKTINWVNATDAWTASEHWNLASGKEYRINGNSVLTSTTLGSGVVNSSLQSVGTIGTGVWQGTIISPTYGGTGINNGTKTITLGGNFTHSGAHTLTLNTTGNTSVTLPTSGTLAITGNPLSQFAATTSLQLAGVISDETGTGVLVFGTSPSFTTGINAASTTMALFNTTATTINFGQAATSLVMGATTGTTRVRNNLEVDLDLYIDGGDLIVSGTTFNIATANATTVNFATAATALDIGAATGTTSINNNLDVDGDLNVDGGDISTNQAAFNLLNTNATTVNFGGGAATINIGAATSSVNFADDVDIAGNLTIDGTITVPAINGTPIGNLTPSTGAFTTLASSGLTTFTNTTASTSVSTGAVVITGGLGVGGAVYADSFHGDIDTSNVTSGTFADARIAQSNVTQHQLAITGVGALNAGSITTGFGNINIGSSIFTGNGSGLTDLSASNLSTGTVAGARLGGNQSMAGVKTFTDTTDSSSVSSGAVRIAGGLGVAKNLYALAFYGDGANVTSINATNISSGTINDARLPVTQTGKTFSSDITVNSHKVGRGGGNSATNLAIAGGQLISTGTDNMLIGVGAGAGIVTGTDNVALGNSALAALTSATHNTAVGNDSQAQRTGTGNNNTSVGAQSMANSTSGSDNAALGYQALELVTGGQNVGIGSMAGDTLTSGTNNILIGYNAQPSAVTVSNEITLGNASHTNLRIPGIDLTASTTTVQFNGTNGFAGVGTSLTALNASQLTSGTVPDARIAQTSVTQHQLAITGVGILNAGSITSGFGSIDIGADNLTATGTVSLGTTSFNDNNITNVGNIALDSLSADGVDINSPALWRFTNATEATSTTVASVAFTGGVGIAKNVHVGGTITGNGSGITALNASELSTGTVPSARVSGSYTGITGVGALAAGQITSGFGDINIGTSTFTGNGSGLTSVNADTLDSIDSASFVRSDANDDITGLLNISRTGEMLRIADTSATGSPYVSLYQTTTRRGYIQYVNGGTFRIANEGSASRIDFSTGTTGLKFFDGTNTSTVWHAANDGSGSGLDADLLDGVQAASFLRSDANDSFTGTLSGTGSINISGTVTATSFTGDGSGLTGIGADNANTLDGLDSTQFLRSDADDTMTGILTVQSAVGQPSSIINVIPNSTTFSSEIRLHTNSTGSAYHILHNDGGFFKIGTRDTNPVQLITNNIERMSFAAAGGTTNTGNFTVSSGDVIPLVNNTGNVGTAARTWANGQFTNLTIDGTLSVRTAIDLADSDVLRFGTSDDWELFHDGTNNYMDLNVGNLLIRDAVTTRFTFEKTTGNFTATGEVTAYSDASLKDNVEVIADPLTKILSIRGVTFTRNDQEDQERRHMGVIAQEVEQYFPEVVHTTEDGIKTVNYGAMAGAFIEAFKAQQAQINELRAMIQKLADK